MQQHNQQQHELSPEEAAEAERIAAIAKRAEERARLRAALSSSSITQSNNGVKFIPKSQRDALQKKPSHNEEKLENNISKNFKQSENTSKTSSIAIMRAPEINSSKSSEKIAASKESKSDRSGSTKRKFKFQWDASEDTMTRDAYCFNNSSLRTDNIPVNKSLHVDKESHWSEKRLVDMTPRDWRIVREDNDIIVRGPRAPYPNRGWSEMDLPNEVFNNIRKAGYTKPSPIQMQAIPVVLQYRDMIGVAETGSGKTAAFAIPVITAISKLPQNIRNKCAEDGPLGLVMAPVRELVQQIAEEIRKLSEGTGIRVGVIIGGNSIQDQIASLSAGCDIVVATPGRLLDCLEHRYTVFNQVHFIVLDEADRMIDMGFQPQVEKVLSNICSLEKSTDEKIVTDQESKASKQELIVRITIMFSATMPPEVQNLAQTFMRFPVIVRIGDRDTGKNRNITQRIFYMSSAAQKVSKLLSLIKETQPPIIVFVNSRQGCDAVGEILHEAGHRCVVLHGGKQQSVREASLAGFANGKYSVLIATDVAGRGLDIDNVAHVINYEMASDIDRYCHRIGRTGRAGRHGIASTLISEDDSDIFFDLVQYMKSTKMQIPRELMNHPKSQVKLGWGDDQQNGSDVE